MILNCCYIIWVCFQAVALLFGCVQIVVMQFRYVVVFVLDVVVLFGYVNKLFQCFSSYLCDCCVYDVVELLWCLPWYVETCLMYWWLVLLFVVEWCCLYSVKLKDMLVVMSFCRTSLIRGCTFPLTRWYKGGSLRH